MGKSDYHEKKERRIERYENLSNKAEKESNAAYKQSHDMVKHIPMGQPILVGHHSEKSHRRTLDKSWNALGKSVKLQEKSDYYQEKAQAARDNNAISSDNPDAIELLEEKIETLRKSQDKMKAINKICRSKKLSEVEIHEKLEKEFGLSNQEIYTLLNPNYSYQKKGFPSYSISNNNQNINRLKKRLKKLKALEEMENQVFVYGENKVVVNVDDNRVEIHYPGKPTEEIRKHLKSRGFRWSPMKGSWQKMISRWNIEEAKKVAQLV